jgi:hypothetical protein
MPWPVANSFACQPVKILGPHVKMFLCYRKEMRANSYLLVRNSNRSPNVG